MQCIYFQLREGFSKTNHDTYDAVVNNVGGVIYN